jgi:DNA-binding response OmpR family regulator
MTSSIRSISQEPAVILIIDEDPVILTGMAAVLKMSGYECHCARDRAAALKGVKRFALDLIICDVNVGGESGLALCRELRDEPGMDEVPAMFMSSAQIPDIVRRSHEAGGAYYLRKPFDPEVLTELVSKALWMPHLVQTRVSRVQAAAETVPAPPKMGRVADALQGIKIPLA